MENNNKLSFFLGKFVGTIFSLVAAFFICVLIDQEWAISLLAVINIISLEQVNFGFVIVPAAAGYWCFNQAEKFEKKDKP